MYQRYCKRRGQGWSAGTGARPPPAEVTNVGGGRIENINALLACRRQPSDQPRWLTGRLRSLEANRERLATHCLNVRGYVAYVPKIAVTTPKARRTTALLFPGYAFVQIISGWWEARWSAGVVRTDRNRADPTPGA